MNQEPTFVIANGNVHWFTRRKEAEGFELKKKSENYDVELIEDGWDHPKTRKVLDARIRTYTLHNRHAVVEFQDGEIISSKDNNWEAIAA